MNSYLALLRGVNVGGSSVIRMEDLRKLLESLGFIAVKTYLQSGNVIFQSSFEDTKKIGTDITDAILDKSNLKVPVMILSLREVKEIMEKNPLLSEQSIDKSSLYISILEDIPKKESMGKLMSIDFSPDRFAIIGRVVYLYLPRGYSKSKLNTNFLESKLGLLITTRGWATMLALEKLLDASL